MKGYNKAIIMGNVARDPEIRYTASQRAVASFTVAVNRSWRDSNGESREEVDFIPVVVWGKSAEFCERNVKKGTGLLVEGRISVRSYETKTGEKRWVTEIVAENLQFAGGPPRRDDSSSGQERGSYQGSYGQRGQAPAARSYRDSQPQRQGAVEPFPMDISDLDPSSSPAPQSDDEADIPF